MAGATRKSRQPWMVRRGSGRSLPSTMVASTMFIVDNYRHVGCRGLKAPRLHHHRLPTRPIHRYQGP